jgi:hypothetical protein
LEQFRAGDVLTIGKIFLQRNYEGRHVEELAHAIGFHPLDETDAGKLGREVDLSATRDNGLVLNQEKRRDDALGV